MVKWKIMLGGNMLIDLLSPIFLLGLEINLETKVLKLISLSLVRIFTECKILIIFFFF